MTTRIASSLIMLVLSVCCQGSQAKVVGDFDHLMRAIDNDVNHQEVRECGKLLEGHLGHLEVTRSNMDGLHSPHMNHASPLLVWGVTMTAVTLIVVCDVMAILVVPVLQKMFLNQVNQFLIAMSVGSLTGDAFLHLVPHAMAANSHHSEMEQEDSHGHDSVAVWKGFVALSGIVGFFIFEKLVGKLGQWQNKAQMKEDNKSEAIAEDGENNREESAKASVFNQQNGHSHHNQSNLPDSVSSVAWMILMGDGLHTFADGLAVGAAFSESMSSGFATAVAVLCHELPHKIGDFAMLIQTGLQVKKAVWCNLICSALSFVGAAIGIVVGGHEDVGPWIFMVTAGIFIYIALVDMAPELRGQKESWDNSLSMQVTGMVVGSSIMLAIALCEEKIHALFDQH